MKKTIITISREYGSGGRLIGEKLAERLNLPFYEKNILIKAAKQKNIPIEEAEKYDEALAYNFFKNADLLFGEEVEQIVEASKNSCVIVGRCADRILRGEAIKVFIYAPDAVKIARVKEEKKLSTDKEAADLMKLTNKRRKYHYEYYTAEDWADFKNFDLMIDSSKLGIDGTVELILDYVAKLGK